MTKLTKLPVVYVPVAPNLRLPDMKLSEWMVRKENVFVLTESELREFTMKALIAGSAEQHPDEFIKQNIKL